LKGLKARTKCYNCGEYKHWAVDCPKPKKTRPNSKKNINKIDQGFSEANLAESLYITSSDDSDTTTDDDTGEFAFMATLISSFAFTASTQSDVWFADSGASEHMTDRRDWFDTF
jgi:hypothetical protein